MKSNVRFWVAGLVLLTCVTPALAQKAIPWDFASPPGFFFEGTPLPPIPPIPPIPPLPPIPPIPPIPPLPPMEHFHYLFGEQSRAGAAVDPKISLQQEVFRSLLRNAPDRALDLAAERLKADPADPVVLANLQAIANTTSSKALPLLVSIAKTSTNLDARRSAMSAIARTSGDKSNGLAVLEDLYNSNGDNVDMRRAVLSSMARLSDPRTVSVLTRIAKTDADLSLRRAAVQYLGSRSEAEAYKALEELLKDPGRGGQL